MTTTVLAYIPSPSQGVWHLGPIPLRAYAFFIIIGIIAALVIGDRRWVARGGQAGVIYDIALLAVPFGLIGGRLYHVMTDWRTYFGDDGAGLLGALRIWDGGLGIWGAVALGGVGAWIACRFWKGIPLPAFGDAIAPGIILAQAIGRLGNYFNQELYGRPTTLPWGLEIYERRDASGALDTLNGVSTGQRIEVVHPTFLYELLWNLLIFAALIYIDRRFKIGHGRLFATYVAGYCLGRFWVELMRSDVATHIAGIRVNSFTSTFVFIGAVVYIMVAPKGREDPASLAGKPEKGEEVEDSVETFAKELTAVAATTGVVAAAKAAGEAEDEDAEATKDEQAHDDKAAEEPEAVEDAAEEPKQEAAESEAGLGAVEGEEAAEAQEAAPEVHEAEVEAADEAATVADQATAEAEDTEAQAEEPKPGAEEPERESASGEAAQPAEPEAGLGAVESEEAAEALEAAPEIHQAETQAADEAAAVADEVLAEDAEPSSEAAAEADALAADVSEAPAEDIAEAEEFAAAGEDADAESDDDSEPDEPETEAAEASVEDAAFERSEDESAEDAEAVAEEADAAAEQEPKTGVLEKAEVEATTVEPETVEGYGGRLSRWLRRNR